MSYDERLEQLNWEHQPVPPRRRRWPYRLAITVLVLVGLFTAADRIAVGIAQNQIASRIQKSQNLASKPAVSIDGFPFLTQLIGMKLGKVSLDARGVMRNGVRVTDLQADLHGVKPSNGFKEATVDELDGTAYFDFADLQAAAASQGLDVTISDAGNDRVRISGTVQMLGQSVPATVDSQLILGSNNQITVRAVKLETTIPGLSGRVPAGLDYKIPVGTLPLGMTLHDIKVASDGVRISATAQNVTLTGSGIQPQG
jgi:hypothetical protein